MNQEQLLQWINEVSFAVTDILLYLDTHPDDQDAMAFFDHYNAERKRAMEAYSANFTPLTVDMIPENSNHWYWVTDPWPWEGVNC